MAGFTFSGRSVFEVPQGASSFQTGSLAPGSFSSSSPIFDLSIATSGGFGIAAVPGVFTAIGSVLDLSAFIALSAGAAAFAGVKLTWAEEEEINSIILGGQMKTDIESPGFYLPAVSPLGGGAWRTVRGIAVAARFVTVDIRNFGPGTINWKLGIKIRSRS